MNASTVSLLRTLGALTLAGLIAHTSTGAPDSEAVRPTEKVSLFNGRDLTGWLIIGRDNDPTAKQTWSVRDGALVATGMPYGYVRTTRAFRDYVLHVEWRWSRLAPAVDANGKSRSRNSGVLLHIQGQDKVWPTCLEGQLQEGNAGDFIAMTPEVTFKQLRTLREKAAIDAGANAATRKLALTNRRVSRQQPSSEKPAGEWNTYEITCRGDTVTLKVNGVVQNTATGVSIRDGAIGLQSEGMPVEFRNVVLMPLVD